MSTFKPILYDELFKLITLGDDEEWEKFSSEYKHVFTPGFFSQLPDTEIYDLFNHYQFLSIEYWNIYSSSLINSENNKIRSNQLLKKYREIWEGKAHNKNSTVTPGINERKIKEIDDFEFAINYPVEEILDPSLSAAGPYFSEIVFCSILYSFFEEILTTFVFNVSGSKCFFNNIKYKDHYFYKTNRYTDLYKDYMKHSIKEPKRKDYKNLDDYYSETSRYRNITKKSLPEIKNNEWLEFYRNNKSIDGREVPDYIIKAKYIDQRCNSTLYSDLISQDRFKEFKIKRNNVMHAKSYESNISTLACFDIITDLLNFLINDKNIINQYSSCISQNSLRFDIDKLDDDDAIWIFRSEMTY